MLPEKGIYYTFFAGLTVIGILVAFSVISIIRQHRRRIKEVKGQVMRDMELIEEERKRIAADLHDNLGSILSSVRISLDNINEDLPGSQKVTKAITNIETSIATIKQIAHNLMPGILVAWGLGAAIHELVEELNILGKMTVHFNNDCNDKEFAPGKSVLVFRIIQEILSNAMKHSEASLVVITISCWQQYLKLEISDNGKGFDEKQRNPNGKHFGLQNICSRLELLNANYKLESAPGKGTRYMIEIPTQTMKLSYDKTGTD